MFLLFYFFFTFLQTGKGGSAIKGCLSLDDVQIRSGRSVAEIIPRGHKILEQWWQRVEERGDMGKESVAGGHKTLGQFGTPKIVISSESGGGEVFVTR